MSKTLQELYVEVIKDASLVSEFAKAEKDGKTAEFAAAHGCSVSEEEIKAFIDGKKNSDVELSLDELETVAGGKPDSYKTEPKIELNQIDTFRCTVCGELTTTPFSEMSKGCPKCGGKLAMTH